MSHSSIAVRARQRAEAMMTSTCTIFTNGAAVTDPDSGLVTRPATTIYVGKCRVRPAATGLTALSEDIAGTELFRFDYRVSVPFEVSEVFEGQRIRIESSPDPSLPGLLMEVQRVDRGDDISARRLICQRVGTGA